mgnify:CR=1 FL=1
MRRKTRLAEKVLFASKVFRLTKTARFGIIVTAILSFLIFAISFYGMEAGNFTFTVDQRAYQIGVTLYENADNKRYSTRLLAEKVENADGMTDLCGTEFSTRPLGHPSCIPSNEEIHSKEGSNNGESYIAYTFYVEMQSNGNYVADLIAEIDIISTSKGAEEALRVKVIIDGVATVYARRQSEYGQNPGELEPYTDQEFHGPSTVMRQSFINFNPGDVKKVSVVIWYEGYDADHTINLWSGGVKLAMNFTVTNVVLLEDDTN